MNKYRPSLLALTQITLIPAAFFLLTACQTVQEPITGRSQFILISPQQEASLGMSAWQDLKEEKEISQNRKYQDALQRVGERVAAAVDQDHPGFDWEFQVFASDEANAFCLPGGKIGVYEGMFEYFENDAELAVVVGHEVAHAVARHGAERMTQAILINLGALGIAAATHSQEEERRERILLAYAGLSTLGYILPYSRQHEHAADHLGMIFMARAGYDPEAAISFWTKFQSDTHALDRLGQYFSTHPHAEDRLQRMHSILPQARREYQAAPRQKGLGQSY